MFMVYICSLTRSVVSLHTLIHSLVPKNLAPKTEGADKKDKEKDKEGAKDKADN